MLSVIIPAHNEESVIGRCLSRLLDGLPPDRSDVIVICNGCTDRTAATAAAFGPPVRVIEIEVASKSAALNRGDDEARGHPRVYLDADVELSGYDVVKMARALEEPGGPLAVAPRLRVDLGNVSRVVRAYYRVWLALPYANEAMIGSGVYALSAEGRSRFGDFPSIIGDDLFVYRLFEPGDRVTVAGADFTVHPPRRLADLLKVHGRRRAGIVEYEELHGGRQSKATKQPGPSAALGQLARDPRWWPSLMVYVGVAVAGKVLGRWKARFGDLKVWDREETSRSAYSAP